MTSKDIVVHEDSAQNEDFDSEESLRTGVSEVKDVSIYGSGLTLCKPFYEKVSSEIVVDRQPRARDALFSTFRHKGQVSSGVSELLKAIFNQTERDLEVDQVESNVSVQVVPKSLNSGESPDRRLALRFGRISEERNETLRNEDDSVHKDSKTRLELYDEGNAKDSIVHLKIKNKKLIGCFTTDKYLRGFHNFDSDSAFPEMKQSEKFEDRAIRDDRTYENGDRNNNIEHGPDEEKLKAFGRTLQATLLEDVNIVQMTMLGENVPSAEMDTSSARGDVTDKALPKKIILLFDALQPVKDEQCSPQDSKETSESLEESTKSKPDIANQTAKIIENVSLKLATMTKNLTQRSDFTYEQESGFTENACALSNADLMPYCGSLSIRAKSTAPVDDNVAKSNESPTGEEYFASTKTIDGNISDPDLTQARILSILLKDKNKKKSHSHEILTEVGRVKLKSRMIKPIKLTTYKIPERPEEENIKEDSFEKLYPLSLGNVTTKESQVLDDVKENKCVKAPLIRKTSYELAVSGGGAADIVKSSASELDNSSNNRFNFLKITNIPPRPGNNKDVTSVAINIPSKMSPTEKQPSEEILEESDSSMESSSTETTSSSALQKLSHLEKLLPCGGILTLMKGQPPSEYTSSSASFSSCSSLNWDNKSANLTNEAPSVESPVPSNSESIKEVLYIIKDNVKSSLMTWTTTIDNVIGMSKSASENEQIKAKVTEKETCTVTIKAPKKPVIPPRKLRKKSFCKSTRKLKSHLNTLLPAHFSALNKLWPDCATCKKPCFAGSVSSGCKIPSLEQFSAAAEREEHRRLVESANTKALWKCSKNSNLEYFYTHSSEESNKINYPFVNTALGKKLPPPFIYSEIKDSILNNDRPIVNNYLGRICKVFNRRPESSALPIRFRLDDDSVILLEPGIDTCEHCKIASVDILWARQHVARLEGRHIYANLPPYSENYAVLTRVFSKNEEMKIKIMNAEKNLGYACNPQQKNEVPIRRKNSSRNIASTFVKGAIQAIPEIDEDKICEIITTNEDKNESQNFQPTETDRKKATTRGRRKKLPLKCAQSSKKRSLAQWASSLVKKRLDSLLNSEQERLSSPKSSGKGIEDTSPSPGVKKVTSIEIEDSTEKKSQTQLPKETKLKRKITFAIIEKPVPKKKRRILCNKRPWDKMLERAKQNPGYRLYSFDFYYDPTVKLDGIPASINRIEHKDRRIEYMYGKTGQYPFSFGQYSLDEGRFLTIEELLLILNGIYQPPKKYFVTAGNRTSNLIMVAKLRDAYIPYVDPLGTVLCMVPYCPARPTRLSGGCLIKNKDPAKWLYPHINILDRRKSIKKQELLWMQTMLFERKPFTYPPKLVRLLYKFNHKRKMPYIEPKVNRVPKVESRPKLALPDAIAYIPIGVWNLSPGTYIYPWEIDNKIPRVFLGIQISATKAELPVISFHCSKENTLLDYVANHIGNITSDKQENKGSKLPRLFESLKKRCAYKICRCNKGGFHIHPTEMKRAYKPVVFHQERLYLTKRIFEKTDECTAFHMTEIENSQTSTSPAQECVTSIHHMKEGTLIENISKPDVTALTIDVSPVDYDFFYPWNYPNMCNHPVFCIHSKREGSMPDIPIVAPQMTKRTTERQIFDETSCIRTLHDIGPSPSTESTDLLSLGDTTSSGTYSEEYPVQSPGADSEKLHYFSVQTQAEVYQCPATSNSDSETSELNESHFLPEEKHHLEETILRYSPPDSKHVDFELGPAHLTTGVDLYRSTSTRSLKLNSELYHCQSPRDQSVFANDQYQSGQYYSTKSNLRVSRSLGAFEQPKSLHFERNKIKVYHRSTEDINTKGRGQYKPKQVRRTNEDVAARIAFHYILDGCESTSRSSSKKTPLSKDKFNEGNRAWISRSSEDIAEIMAYPCIVWGDRMRKDSAVPPKKGKKDRTQRHFSRSSEDVAERIAYYFLDSSEDLTIRDSGFKCPIYGRRSTGPVLKTDISRFTFPRTRSNPYLWEENSVSREFRIAPDRCNNILHSETLRKNR